MQQELTHRIALAQVASHPEESKAARLARVGKLLRDKQDELRAAGEKPIEMFVLPELWSSGFFCFGDFAALAEQVDPAHPAESGPTVQFGHRFAQELNCWLHLGSVLEKHPDGTLTNTALVFNPAGEIVQLYRKVHVFGYQSEEQELLSPGNLLPVLTTPFGDLASTTCYDLRFPGLWTELANRGASIIVTPAAWPHARLLHWQTLTQARAIEQQSWVLACNSCETQRVTSTRSSVVESVQLGGNSAIISPSGEIVARAGLTEEIIWADVAAGLPTKLRTNFPVFDDRLTPSEYANLAAGTAVTSRTAAPTAAVEPDSSAAPAVSGAAAKRIRVSAVVMRDPAGNVLNVRKRGTSSFMLPGGKPEPGEDALGTAVREFREELGIDLEPTRMRFIGLFEAQAANEPGHTVEAAVYEHPYLPAAGEATSRAEIAELAWCDPAVAHPHMAPLNTDVIFPALITD